MLFHSAYDPNTPVYHDIFYLQLTLRLDPELLRQTINDLVVRGNSVLRTSFRIDEYGESLQLVHREAEVEIDFEDLSPLPAAQREEVLQHWFEAEKRRPFDPRQPGLLRFKVQKLSAESFQLGLSFSSRDSRWVERGRAAHRADSRLQCIARRQRRACASAGRVFPEFY